VSLALGDQLVSLHFFGLELDQGSFDIITFGVGFGHFLDNPFASLCL
jgi:hypothetical protein